MKEKNKEFEAYQARNRMLRETSLIQIHFKGLKMYLQKEDLTLWAWVKLWFQRVKHYS